MIDKKEKWGIALVVLAIIIIAIYFLFIKKRPPTSEPVYMEGLRTEVLGGTPEQNELIRRRISNVIRSGNQAGIPSQHLRAIRIEMSESQNVSPI